MSAAELRELIDDIVERAAPGTDLWPTLEELGLSAVGVPEAAGGPGGTVLELADVAEALGAHGAHTPLIERATSAWALACAGHDPVPAATIAVIRDDTEAVAPTVPWATGASHLLLIDLGGQAPALLDLTDPAVTLSGDTDVTGAPLHRVEWSRTRPTPLPDGPATPALVARVALLRAAAIVGAARAAYQLTRAHVRTREQFGRPLVALPAVAASLARMRVEVIQAGIALRTARDQADGPKAFSSAVAARLVCAGVATEIAQLSHQLHGAIGITREYPLHPLSRAMWAGRDADLPEERWACLLGDQVLNGGEAALWEKLT